jgi:hypothetical protein
MMQQDYEITIHRIVSRYTIAFDTPEEARQYAARIKQKQQEVQPNSEVWFEYKVLGTEPDQFLLQIVTDGAVTWSKQYDNALDAVKAYDKVIDYGFAKFEREAVLIEPNGKVHTKLFQVPYGVAIA